MSKQLQEEKKDLANAATPAADVNAGDATPQNALPRPFYQDSAVTIYHGDCRQIVPFLGHFDLLLTDPPYGIGKDGQLQTTGGHGGRKAYDFLGWDRERPQTWLIQMLLDSAEKHIIWGGNYFADLLPATMKWLVWDKGQRINQSDGELAYTSMAGALRICTMNRVELMTDGAQHPTQKPEKLMAWCIQEAEPVTTILDPFAGSGTTGRAAKDAGKLATLIEREGRYCEIAAKRMEQEVLDFRESQFCPSTVENHAQALLTPNSASL